MKEVKRKGKFGCEITIRFNEQFNEKVEETVIGLLMDSYENRIDVLHRIDKLNGSMV